MGIQEKGWVINPRPQSFVMSKYHDTSFVSKVKMHTFRFERPALSLESQVVHPNLNYHGYMDCVAKFSEGLQSK